METFLDAVSQEGGGFGEEGCEVFDEDVDGFVQGLAGGGLVLGLLLLLFRRHLLSRQPFEIQHKVLQPFREFQACLDLFIPENREDDGICNKVLERASEMFR